MEKMPTKLYNYFRKDGAADRFVSGLDKSIRTNVTSYKDRILCSLSENVDDAEIYINLDSKKTKESINQFETVALLLNSLIQKYKNRTDMGDMIKKELIYKIKSLGSIHMS